uniref:E3 ubiquitin-protein ligase RNF13 n=1 Tax=Anthurium amnicola TaxID=1678845 RepID=A0A1D1XM03_9ARAE
MGSFKLLNGSFVCALIILFTASLICAQGYDNSANNYALATINNPRTYCNNVKNLYHPPSPLEIINGTLQLWPPTNQSIPDTDWIAFINCEGDKNITTDITYASKAEHPASAILLYSTRQKICTYNIQSMSLSDITVPLFTTDLNCYDELQGLLVRGNNQVLVAIKSNNLAGIPPDPSKSSLQGLLVRGNNQVLVAIKSNNLAGIPPDPSKSSPQGPPAENKVLATYQTAMIVLYAVSGVVLGLFFIVVVTNIIKNRLNVPTPQVSQGQDPSSRPRRGIARSVLESFPVFFFTMGLKDEDDDKKEKDDLEKGKAKDLESDIELENINSDVMKSAPEAEETKDKDLSDISTDNNTSKTNNNDDDNSQERNLDLPENPLIAHIKDSSSSRPISTTSNLSATNKVQDGQLTCPICLDDFESGEELRLLPCQHRYHTICIDPWLLDISPLCPMCKTDYTSWESEMNATQHNQDSSGSSSSVESTGNSNNTTNNDNQRSGDDDPSIVSSIPHNFPHFRWIKYLTAIRRRRRNRDRRSSRQSRIVELINNNNNNNNNNSSASARDNVVGTIITG